MNEIQTLINGEKYQDALILANKLLDENPKDLTTLFQIGEVLLLTDRLGLAFNIYQYLSLMAPERSEIWNNLGRCLQTRKNTAEARKYFEKALSVEPNNASALINLSILDVNEGNAKRAVEMSSRALKSLPTSRQARDVLSMAKLAVHDWTGWVDYRYSEGPPFRRLRQYKEPSEAEWNGESGKTVVIYREQGLGDEILFGSCIPEAIAISRKVIIDCDPRMVGFFKRTYPQADVYGTGYSTDITWDKKYQIDASCPMGRLPLFFRKRDEDFIKTQGKYLNPCPLRKKAYRAMLDGLPGLKIGLAWNGGKKADSVTKDDSEYRSLKLADLAPLIQEGNTYISLEYKSATKEIEESSLPVLDWPWITESKDYDDTAALVSELDYIISVPTTVVHLAGALNVHVYCLTPEFSNWRFGNKDMIWHKSVKIFRNKGDWKQTINQLRSCLEARYNPASGAGSPRACQRSHTISQDRLSDIARSVQRGPD